MRNNGRNKNAKFGKNQNAWSEGKLQVLGISEADTIKHTEMKKMRKD